MIILDSFFRTAQTKTVKLGNKPDLHIVKVFECELKSELGESFDSGWVIYLESDIKGKMLTRVFEGSKVVDVNWPVNHFVPKEFYQLKGDLWYPDGERHQRTCFTEFALEAVERDPKHAGNALYEHLISEAGKIGALRELEPCPLCGADVEQSEVGSIHCHGCGLSASFVTPYSKDKTERRALIANQWNRRDGRTYAKLV